MSKRVTKEVVVWEGYETNEKVEKRIEWFLEELGKGDVDLTDVLPTEFAIDFIKAKMFGGYHGILIMKEELFLDDSEIYLLTWECEANQFGEGYKLTVETLIDLLLETEKAELGIDED